MVYFFFFWGGGNLYSLGKLNHSTHYTSNIQCQLYTNKNWFAINTYKNIARISVNTSNIFFVYSLLLQNRVVGKCTLCNYHLVNMEIPIKYIFSFEIILQ